MKERQNSAKNAREAKLHEKTISRRQFLQKTGKLAAAIATFSLTSGCGRTQEQQDAFKKLVVEEGITQQQEVIDLMRENLMELRGNPEELQEARTIATEEEVDTAIMEDLQSSPAPVANNELLIHQSKAEKHVREQVNMIMSQFENDFPDLHIFNPAITSWLRQDYIDTWIQGKELTHQDLNVLEQSIPYAWDSSVRSQVLHIMGHARMNDKFPGRDIIPDDLINYTWRAYCLRHNLDYDQFANNDAYEQTRYVTIEAAARAVQARKEMYEEGLFEVADQAIPTLGTLIPLAFYETSGWQNIGSEPANNKIYYEQSLNSAVMYLVNYMRKYTGVTVPYKLPGSSAGAIGPQIMPPAFQANVNYAKKRNTFIHPLGIEDGYKHIAIFLQQQMYNARTEGNDQRWYFHNTDDDQAYQKVMMHWNPIPQDVAMLAHARRMFIDQFGDPLWMPA
ncbi:MAG: hypothetical protein ACOCXQ_00280 [Patescibacteria group bacterium]